MNSSSSTPISTLMPSPKDFFHARTAFTTAVQEGNAPDVFRSDVSWAPLFASEGYLLNIDSYVSQSDLSDY